jgi:multiple sugar transport system ATP-binding protein
LSVYRNLALGLELRLGGGFGAQVLRRLINPRRAAEWAEQRQGIAARVRQTAERLGIKHLLDRKPHQLSGGERQRVALGRAIVRNPAAFLFDEPLSNLDAKLRQAMRTELKELHRSLNNTMVYVTHDQIEAMTLGQRVAVLNRGELQQVAEPTALYQQPANLFVAQFFGATPLNLARGRWTAETGQRVWRSGPWEWRIPAEHPHLRQIPATDSELILGVRAEDITIQTGEITAEAARAASPSVSPPVLDSQVLEVDHWGDSCVAQVLGPERVDSPDHWAEAGKWHVRGSTASGREWRRGRPVKLVISPERIMWFDSATHKNLTT